MKCCEYVSVRGVVACTASNAHHCQGIVHLHSRQVIHGDIKPQNILLDEHFHAHISDWGVSRVSLGVTRTGDAGHAGFTEGYAAPEVKDGGKCTFASDMCVAGLQRCGCPFAACWLDAIALCSGCGRNFAALSHASVLCCRYSFGRVVQEVMSAAQRGEVLHALSSTLRAALEVGWANGVCTCVAVATDWGCVCCTVTCTSQSTIERLLDANAANRYSDGSCYRATPFR